MPNTHHKHRIGGCPSSTKEWLVVVAQAHTGILSNLVAFFQRRHWLCPLLYPNLPSPSRSRCTRWPPSAQATRSGSGGEVRLSEAGRGSLCSNCEPCSGKDMHYHMYALPLFDLATNQRVSDGLSLRGLSCGIWRTCSSQSSVPAASSRV